jgi:chorismate synthase
MIRYMTAGESHGKGLTVIIDGVPSQLKLAAADIDMYLLERQKGYGRGGRQKIEKDKVEFLGGVRHGKTTGAPICMFIKNSDFANWHIMMDSEPVAEKIHALNVPRPGHADLAGGIKYGHYDFRNVLERASARETAARVAAGAVCGKILNGLGIEVFGYVMSIGGIHSGSCGNTVKEIKKNISAVQEKFHGDLRFPDIEKAGAIISMIDRAASDGDTLGGTVKVIAEGLPAGLGDYTQWDKKIDGRIAAALMSIQAVKGVEFGAGFSYADNYGSKMHDSIYYSGSKGFYRMTNNAGGIEGGMTNGEQMEVQAVLKPISTVKRGLDSVNAGTKKKVKTVYERSDVCAVPAASLIAAAVVSIELLSAVLDAAGGSNMALLEKNYSSYKKQVKSY